MNKELYTEIMESNDFVYAIVEDGTLQKVRIVAYDDKEFIYENNGFDCSGTDYCDPVPFDEYKKTWWIREDKSE